MTDNTEQCALAEYLIAQGLVPANATWQALAGGRTNAIWRVDFDDQSLVCKLFRENGANPLFPNKIADEGRVLKLLTGTGMAPEFVGKAMTPQGACLLYRYVAGRNWRNRLAPVARLLARLHSRPERPDIRVVDSGSAALTAQTLDMLAGCSGAQARALRDRQPTGDIKAVPAPVLVHGDVVPNNLLVTNQGPMLIDWQCPALADPCEDIATFLSPAMQVLYDGAVFNPPEIEAFLKAYGNPEVAERYRQLAPFFHWRMAAYCLWKAQQGAKDYAAAIDLELAAL